MTEVWKDIEGYEGIYQVSNLGRVRSLDRVVFVRYSEKGTPIYRPAPGKVLYQSKCRDNGYLYVSLFLDRQLEKVRVCMLVAKAFIANPDGLPDVTHIDGNRENNRADNLRWQPLSESLEGEEWKPVEGFDGAYDVSNMGRVRCSYRYVENNGRLNFARGQILEPVTISKGYKKVNLNKDGKNFNRTIHRLVAKAFIPNPDNLPCVNHKNETPSDNRAENLEWCTHKYNNNYGHYKEHVRDSIREGHRMNAVEQTDTDGNVIQTYESVSEAARAMNVSRRAIRNCINGASASCNGYRWRYANNQNNNDNE